MSLYIERGIVIDKMQRALNDENNKGSFSRFYNDYKDGLNDGIKICIAIAATIPGPDVVRVVRCKDCKHRNGLPGQPNILCA